MYQWFPMNYGTNFYGYVLLSLMLHCVGHCVRHVGQAMIVLGCSLKPADSFGMLIWRVPGRVLTRSYKFYKETLCLAYKHGSMLSCKAKELLVYVPYMPMS